MCFSSPITPARGAPTLVSPSSGLAKLSVPTHVNTFLSPKENQKSPVKTKIQKSVIMCAVAFCCCLVLRVAFPKQRVEEGHVLFFLFGIFRVAFLNSCGGYKL